MNKSYLIVTLIQQYSSHNYDPLFSYLEEFPQTPAVAPTPATQSIYIFTDKTEKEIQKKIRSLLGGPMDYCYVESYDDVNGAKEILENAKQIQQWVSNKSRK